MKTFKVYRIVRGQKPHVIGTYNTFELAAAFVRKRYFLVADRLTKIADGYWVLVFDCGNSIRIKEVNESEEQKK